MDFKLTLFEQIFSMIKYKAKHFLLNFEASNFFFWGGGGYVQVF